MLKHDPRVFENAYELLNAKQKEAVDTIDGPLLVVAGPGTGKTELLALRVVNILRKREVSPHNLLCLTFTENGALNMRERLQRYIGQDAFRVGIYTFHAFCNSIIARFPEYFYHAATFSQASDLDRARIIENIFATLPHGHPLASFHPQEGYVYLRDTLDRIKHIKSGGYTPEEYEAVVNLLAKEYPKINSILRGWPEGRASIKHIDALRPILSELEALKNTTAIVLAKSLSHAIDSAIGIGNMEPVSEWKKTYTIKDDEVLVLKDAYQIEKIRAVASIYRSYSDALYEEGLFDYDDVIIEVGHALRNNSSLRSELEEQYQYILIDEFQDTNEAQMSIVRALSSNAVYEGRPNVMVVGDDDQAIYKFQGAEISNIVEFRHATYRDVTTTVLDTNYRSHKNILDFARSVIVQGNVRLEKRYKEIVKILTQGNKDIKNGEVRIKQFGSDVEEYTHISREIHELIKQHVPPENIAVLSRNHREIKAFLPYLDQHEVPYEYTKRSNVFDEPHIQELITVCDYISSVNAKTERKDYLLPTILSYAYFSIPRQVIFSIALKAKESHTSWAQVLSDSAELSVQSVSQLIAEMVTKAESTPLEHLLQEYMEQSGFREYYFGQQTLKQSPTTYVHFLASLKTFIESLREWKEGETLFAKDVAPFVAMHREHDIPLISESPFMKSEHAVSLMSAHGAKGLEFKYVFVIAAHDAIWTKGARVNKSPLPLALTPILTPAGDVEDDFIRLFYVAITRAKRALMISGHKPLIRYIPRNHIEEQLSATKNEPLEVTAHENALSIVRAPYKEDEWAILRRLVKDYRMPVTHLSNFLNITEGGPLYFIEQNLLRFPQPMNVAAVFGSAVHKAIAEMVMFPKYHGGECPSLEHILSLFRFEISRGRLPSIEERKQVKRGEEILSLYQNVCAPSFLPEDSIEVDMKDEGIVIDDALLTGKIDFLRVRDGAYHVRDFKTGRSYQGWDEPRMSDMDKIKLHKYKQQLIYYKLLLEHSSRFTLPIGSLALEFVESVTAQDKPILLEYSPTTEDMRRLRLLINAVFKKIVTLDFPDVSRYEKSFKGMLQFEDDLINESKTSNA